MPYPEEPSQRDIPSRVVRLETLMAVAEARADRQAAESASQFADLKCTMKEVCESMQVLKEGWATRDGRVDTWQRVFQIVTGGGVVTLLLQRLLLHW